jgi:hypothetical protein
MTEVEDRIARLESTVETQRETVRVQSERIDEQQARIEEPDGGDPPADGDLSPDERTGNGSAVVSRRSALKTGGLLGLLGVAGTAVTGTASANPQGQVGTEDDPLKALYTEKVGGGLTGNRTLTDLAGAGLSIDSGSLDSLWTGSDTDGVVEPVADYNGIDVPTAIAEKLTLGDGTAADPALTFEAEPDTGLFRPGDGGLALSANGSEALVVDDFGVSVRNGPLTVGTLDVFEIFSDGFRTNDFETRIQDVRVVQRDVSGVETLETARIRGNSDLTAEANGRRALVLGEPDETVDGNGVGEASPTPNVVAGHATNNTDGATPRGIAIGGGGAEGDSNVVSASFGTVGGGLNNTVSSESATVPGGEGNTASGTHSLAAGQYAEAADDNAFVWNDGSGATASTGSETDQFSSSTTVTESGSEPSGPDTFTVKASEGVRFVTGDDPASFDYDPDYAWITREGDVRTSGRIDAAGEVTSTKNVIASSGYVLGGDLYATDIAPDSGTASVGVQSDGQLVNNSASSARYKTNIRPMDTDGSDVLGLEPRVFEYEETGEEGVGFVAEEVESTAPDLVLYDDEGRPDGVKYHRLGVFLQPEVRENRERASALRDELDEKDDRIDDLETESERKDERIAALEAETETLREENDRLCERLDAIEAELGIDATADQQGVADD